MHELSICFALLDQVQTLAAQQQAIAVERIVVRIGPLSGVETHLLTQAWPLAATGTLAQTAELVFESTPLRVRCTRCNALSDALPNRLLCAVCGDYHTQIESGNELLLAQIELRLPD